MFSVFFDLIVVREFHTPNGYMLHCRDDISNHHFVFLNDGLHFRVICNVSNWDSSDDEFLNFLSREKVDFFEND